jgi:hypothetical protein
VTSSTCGTTGITAQLKVERKRSVIRESAPKYVGAEPVRGCRRHPVAVDRPPQPAVGRDAAHGGLGLYLVARIFVAHGWPVDGDREHVWARIDATGAETRQAGPESAPWRRSGSAGDSPALTVRLDRAAG